MPLPVTRIAPKPSRLISISPPTLNVPDLLASSLAMSIAPSALGANLGIRQRMRKHEERPQL
jgi:hypothetical protein